MKHYLILSRGEYSDYSPIYFVGDKKITDDEFKMASIMLGDEVNTWFESHPERKHREAGDFWFESMEKWIVSRGFKRLPKDIPEINMAYSDYPSSRNQNPDV